MLFKIIFCVSMIKFCITTKGKFKWFNINVKCIIRQYSSVCSSNFLYFIFCLFTRKYIMLPKIINKKHYSLIEGLLVLLDFLPGELVKLCINIHEFIFRLNIDALFQFFVYLLTPRKDTTEFVRSRHGRNARQKTR